MYIMQFSFCVNKHFFQVVTFKNLGFHKQKRILFKALNIVNQHNKFDCWALSIAVWHTDTLQ